MSTAGSLIAKGRNDAALGRAHTRLDGAQNGAAAGDATAEAPAIGYV